MGERKERDQFEGGKVGGREEGRRKWSNKSKGSEHTQLCP